VLPSALLVCDASLLSFEVVQLLLLLLTAVVDVVVGNIEVLVAETVVEALVEKLLVTLEDLLLIKLIKLP
jgi:hypothetical protein